MSNIKPTFILATVFWFLSSFAVAQSIEKSVIAAAGKSSETISYTIGESVTGPSGSIFISAGFQQPPFPFDIITLSTADVTNQLTFYPNPTKRYLNIEGLPLNLSDTKLTVYNIEGRKMIVPTEIKEGIEMDFINQSSGTYFLILEDPKKKITAKFKIVITK